VSTISIGQTITTPLSSVATHEDIFGKGGYRVITITTVDGAAWDANNAHWNTTDAQVQEAINLLVPTSRRKVGMLCHDSTSGRYFRQSGSATWTETFNNDGSIDLANYVQKSDLPLDANGDIDIASEATLQDALLSSVRVDNSGILNIAFGAEERTSNDPSFRFVVDSVADLNAGTPAQISLKLNTAAANPFTA
jgi:hypothetical protein